MKVVYKLTALLIFVTMLVAVIPSETLANEVINDLINFTESKTDLTNISEGNLSATVMFSVFDSEAYAFTGVTLKDDTNVVVNEVVSDGLLQDVTVKRIGTTAPAAKLISTIVNANGALLTMDIQDIDPLQTQDTYTVNLSIPSAGAKARLFIWDDFATMEPLAEVYDSSIILTDITYKNTIQFSNQIHNYTFTVKNDGYYAIAFSNHSELVSSLYHSSNPTNAIGNATSGNNILTALAAHEVYTLKTTATVTGTYSFAISQTAVPSGNSLSVASTKSESITPSTPIMVFSFTPTQTATYNFLVKSSDIYPMLRITESDNSEVAYYDNLIYDSRLAESVVLTTGQTYTIVVKSRKEYTGAFTITPRRVNAALGIDGIVTITGQLSTVSGRRIGVLVFDPENSLTYVTQTISGANGAISCVAKISAAITGTYSVVLNEVNSEIGIQCFFNNESIGKTNIYDFEANSTVTSISATITYDKPYLTSSATVSTSTVVTNAGTRGNHFTVMTALYNASNEMVDFCAGSDFVDVGISKEIETQKTLPSVVTGHTLRTFVWIGDGLYSNALLPICTSSGLTPNGSVTLGSPTADGNELSSLESNESSDSIEYAARQFTVGSVSKSLDDRNSIFSVDTINNPDRNSNASSLNGDGVQYTFKIKNNGQYYSTIMPGANEIEFYFYNNNNFTVDFIPYFWLVSFDGNTLTEKYIQLGNYYTLTAKTGVTIPYKHTVTLENDYTLILIYGDMLDLLFYGDIKGMIRIIPFDTTPTPVVFNQYRGSKYIYSNNPEALTDTDLSDHPTMPTLLLNEKNVGRGNYTLMAEHNNSTNNGSVTLDVEFYTGNTAKIKIKALGVAVPLDEYGNQISWACVNAYADYMQMAFTKNKNYSPKTFNMTKSEVSISGGSVWLSDLYQQIYGEQYPAMHDYYPTLIMLDFEIMEGAVDVNIAAYHDRSNHKSWASDGKYSWTRMHKGIANVAPITAAHLVFTLSNEIPNNQELPLWVFNSYNPYGYAVGGTAAEQEFVTNINPQADIWAFNSGTESDMLSFVYNDGLKQSLYGSSVPYNQKDANWYFDVKHGDNREHISSKTLLPDGSYQLNKSTSTPPNFKPNDILALSPSQSSSTVTSFDLAAPLGNYGVVTIYDLVIINTDSTNSRRFTFWLNTDADNLILVDKGNDIEFFPKGEYNGKQGLAYIDVEPEEMEALVVIQVLTVGPGGMRTSFKATQP